VWKLWFDFGLNESRKIRSIIFNFENIVKNAFSADKKLVRVLLVKPNTIKCYILSC